MLQNVFDEGIALVGNRSICSSASQKTSNKSSSKKTSQEETSQEEKNGRARYSVDTFGEVGEMDVKMNFSAGSDAYHALVERAGDGWSNERSVQMLVERLMMDAIVPALPDDGMGRVVLYPEIQLTVGKRTVRPDLLVVRTARFQSIGVVEVKIPLDTVIDGEKVGTLERIDNVEQIEDYMNHIRSFHGVAHPLGLLTNYNQYRFCWFKGTCAFAKATTEEEAKEALKTTTSNELILSRVYQYDEKNMAHLLAGWIWRMRYAMSTITEKEDFSTHTQNTVDVVLSKEAMSWKVDVRYNLNIDVDSWVLWKYLGNGSSGMVWEAYQRVRNVDEKPWSDAFALKLTFDGVESAELKAWTLLKRGAVELTLNKKRWLQMPMYSQLPDNTKDEDVREELLRLAEKGISHDDLEWRHVLYDAKTNQVRVVDFGRWTEFDCADKDAVASHAEKMWTILEKQRNEERLEEAKKKMS